MKRKTGLLVLCIGLALGVMFTWTLPGIAAEKPMVWDAVTQDGKNIEVKVTRPKANRPHFLGISLPHLKDPFWVDQLYGILNEAEALGVKTTVLSAGGYEHLSRQISQMENLVQRGVNLIISGPISFKGNVAVTEEVVRKGTPVVLFGNTTDTRAWSLAVLNDDYRAGLMVGEYVAKQLGPKGGNVVMLSGPAGASWTTDRSKGARDAFAKNPNIKILAEKWGDIDRALYTKITENVLQTFPKIDYVTAVAFPDTAAAADAIRAAKREKEIRIAASSLDRVLLPYMESGSVDYAVAKGMVNAGRAVVQYAVRFLNGEKDLPRIIWAPVTGYTKETYKQLDFKTEWAPEGWRVPTY